MEISPVTASNSGQAAAPSQDDSSVLTSDYETFLQMLTAQAEYQDPLDPIDSSEYAAQLAQFSMVEQQVLTNDLLTNLTELMGSSGLSGLANWVGMDARAATPVHFDGQPITISPNPAAIADEVDLIVHDEQGRELQRLPLPVSADPFEWAGVDAGGTPFATGTYSFTVESRAEGEVVLSEPAEAYQRVIEAQAQGTETVLVFSGGHAVPASAVTALRAPQA